MNEKSVYEDIKNYEGAFECFKQRFLIDKKSIFDLSDSHPDYNKDSNIESCHILTPENMKYLIDNFINNGYVGNATSIEKFCHQLTNTNLSDNRNNLTNIQKGAIEILATAVWLWRLPASNSGNESRKKSVKEVRDLVPEWKFEITKDNKIFNYLQGNIFFKNEFKGFALPGIGYNINKANELAYIIRFFEQYLLGNDSTIEKWLKTNNTVKITTNAEYNAEDEKVDKKKTGIRIYKKHIKKSLLNDASKVSVCNALLHLNDKENYEPILSDNHKRKIKDVFLSIFNDIEEDSDIDKVLLEIKNKLITINPGYHFYHENITNIWQGSLDFESKNTILHGAPGTGKTYLTEETIKARRIIENNSEYELVQFHPSYGYEDFIEGIKPTEITESGQMKFELKNGIFKQMCVKAFENLRESQNNPKKLKTFYFIADEINRAELSRVFGELLLCLEDDKRLRIVDGKVKGTKVKTPNSNLWTTTEHIVVKVNENDEIDKDGEPYFGVPENIYFIGTMNDIDKSVESFDMALRRRFVWKHYKYSSEPVIKKYEGEDSEIIEKYVLVCENLNKHIVSEKGFGLSESYELGHSYFMKPKKITQKELDRVWLEHISPILKEYLRADYNEKDITQHLKKAQNLFKIN